MYQAPEVHHLQRAVKSIKENLLPQKQTEPEPEQEETESNSESEQASEEA